MLSKQERKLRAQVAANARWSRESPKRQGQILRAAALSRFERQVDPDGVLDTDERRRRAQAAERAHMAKLAYLSSKARRARKAAAP